jgi:hypothetical protein
MDVEIEVKGVNLDFSVKITNVDLDNDGYSDDFGYVPGSFYLAGYTVTDITAYSKKRQQYVPVSPLLAEYIKDTIEDEEEYIDLIWEKIVEDSQPDPDYERDNCYGN